MTQWTNYILNMCVLKAWSVLTHDAADDRGLLGYENVLTIAFVQYT